MDAEKKIIAHLDQKIKERETCASLPLTDYLSFAGEKPFLALRNIFQLFHDMINSYVGKGIDDYPDDPESIHFVYYDCGRLLADGADHPFFADRLFANRLINHIASFRCGLQQNRIYLFEGPHGCGKSTFLNNLLMKFEQYTNTPDGIAFETLWRLNKKTLGVSQEHETSALISQLRSLADGSPLLPGKTGRDIPLPLSGKDYLEVPCPSHDHPLLIIPKPYRREVLDQLIKDEKFKKNLMKNKQYEWIFRENACTICVSLFHVLLDLLDSPAKVFEMIYARRYKFNRRLGQGISVFNPGDQIPQTNILTNDLLQNQLNNLLKDSNRVKYIFSRYASTNNGIYALMDVKDNNKERLTKLHGIISEGVHKVEDIEENVNSMFMALMNPEDRENIVGAQSFLDRITFIKIPYVLDYNTEVKILKHFFGDQIEKKFLPRVLQNFAKVIISTRMREQSDGLREWIGDTNRYNLYSDRAHLLLKMDIYAGLIPAWLTQEDRKKFNAKRRKDIIAESEQEGERGFSGRDAIKIFNRFFTMYNKEGTLINMDMICNFFRQHRKNLPTIIPEGFLDSLVNSYNYTVLQEVKESLYYYNEERISKDIQNYLFAVNFECGRTERCIYTGETIDISDEYFASIERSLMGTNVNQDQRLAFRNEVQNQYASRILTQEILVEGKTVTETSAFQNLYERYVHNLKENVMDPFLENPNFRRGIKDYGTEAFRTYDKKIQEEINFLIDNLKTKYGYDEQGAREVCLYIIDNDLSKTFASPE